MNRDSVLIEADESIAKQLIHAHGGTIDVQSEVGKGITFTIELPRP
ncbi:MAG TPA: hypothetical protein VFR47_21130 [Anaerolineales bacterium]|nr:hypothetical protein [Anaerolineales bacterium]